MNLALQFGWGMMEHTRVLLREWGATSVILSPRDLNPKQLRTFSQDVRQLGGHILLDPQFYLPHSDHHRLVSHDYWPDDYDSIAFWTGSELEGLLEHVVDLNARLSAASIILPGLHASSVSGDWLDQQDAIVHETERLGMDLTECYATVALGDSAMLSEDEVEQLIEGSRNWRVKGIYLIAEHPRGDYLVDNPTWLANELDLVAGWRLQGKQVIVGYSTHQNLIMAAAGASAIASGTWMNVRSFPPEKFRAQYEEEIRRRTTWYYAPVALSEFKIPFLDIAARQGLSDELRAEAPSQRKYSASLFAGVQPSASGFSERDAFRHYLHCLHTQVRDVEKGSFDETVAGLEARLDDAERLLERLHDVGVSGQMRDFGEAIDPCRAALRLLAATRGVLMRREWASL